MNLTSLKTRITVLFDGEDRMILTGFV